MAKKSISDRAKEALSFARDLRAKKQNWLEAHNALFGVAGKCAQLFPTHSDRTAFARTQEYRQINELLNQLPEPPASEAVMPLEEASGNLHVRLPRSLHAALRVEAEAENVSLNQLIVAKLSMQLRALAQAGAEE